MEKPHGALISKVLDDSPAAKAGLKVGDVIVAFNNVTVGTSAELPPLVGTAPIGGKTPVEVMREGKRKTLSVTIGELPEEGAVAGLGSPADPGQASNSKLGISVRNLSPAEREETDLGDKGVLVEKVDEGAGLDAGLRPGDVILQVNSKEVKTVEELAAAVDALKAGARVPILVQRQGTPFIAILVTPCRFVEQV